MVFIYFRTVLIDGLVNRFEGLPLAGKLKALLGWSKSVCSIQDRR